MPAKDAVIRDHILSVIGTSRKGRNKVIRLVQRTRPELSSSRIRRVYEQSGMSLYKRPRRRLRGQKSVPLNVPLLPMQELAMDFMSDCLAGGRRFRTLNVIDHHNRKCLGIFVDFSLPSVKVIEALERVFDMYGTPEAIRTDNCNTAKILDHRLSLKNKPDDNEKNKKKVYRKVQSQCRN